MDTLLAFNADAALVGDLDGGVRTVARSHELSSEQWAEELRYDYLEPDQHWYKDQEGAPFTHTGGYWHQNGQTYVEVFEGVKLYETFSDESFCLSIRATFLPNFQWWIVADTEPVTEHELEDTD